MSSHQLKAIKLLTMYNIDFDTPDDKGWRPIHDICSTGNHLTDNDQYEAIKLLINYGVDLNVGTNGGMRPMHQMAACGGKINGNQCVELIKLMIDKGVDVNVKNKDGKTPFQMASEIPTNHRYSQTVISRIQILTQANINTNKK